MTLFFVSRCRREEFPHVLGPAHAQRDMPHPPARFASLDRRRSGATGLLSGDVRNFLTSLGSPACGSRCNASWTWRAKPIMPRKRVYRFNLPFGFGGLGEEFPH